MGALDANEFVYYLDGRPPEGVKVSRLSGDTQYVWIRTYVVDYYSILLILQDGW